VELSLVVPRYNERDNLAPLLAEIAAALAGSHSYEVIVVDDGSTDGNASRRSSIAATVTPSCA